MFHLYFILELEVAMTPEDAVERLTSRLIKELRNAWVNFTNYSYSLKLLMVLVILSIPALIITFLISLVDSFKYNLSLTPNGVKIIFGLYDAPIKIFAALIGLVTVFTAIKRMQANDKQVAIAEKQMTVVLEQNRLSNFFKYREEFVNHMVTTSFHRYYSIARSTTDPSELYYPLFYNLYGTSKEFNSIIKEDIARMLHDFIHQHIRLANDRGSFLNRFYTREELSTDIKKLENDIPPIEIFEIIFSAFSIAYSINRYFKNEKHFSGEEKSESAVFKLIEYYLGILLIKDLRGFVGGFENDAENKSLLYISTNLQMLTGCSIFNYPYM